MRACCLLPYCCIFLFSLCLSAQSPETKGWIFLSHQQAVAPKWNILFDAQLRSTDQFQYIQTLLLRSALGYKLNKKHSIAIGYAYKGDWEHTADAIKYQQENRIYEQYLFTTKLNRVEVTARVRLEQRFIKENSSYLFSQRARAFVACQIPLIANADFSKGTYINFQDELFANVTHKQNVNHSFFDQNRLLGSVGYRWSPKLDTEVGYMWWRQKQNEGYVSSHVLQLMITTQL